jgi:hypothetical protein
MSLLLPIRRHFSLLFAVTISMAAASHCHHSRAAVPDAPTIISIAATGDIPSEQIRDTARRIMQHNDFRSVRRRILEQVPGTDADADYDKGFLEKILQDMGTAIDDFFQWLFSPSNPNPGGTTSRSSSPSSGVASGLSFGISQIVLYLAIIVIVAIVIWLVAMIVKSNDGRSRSRDRSFLNIQDEDAIDLSVPPGELATSTYESRALQLASEGNFRAAIRELLLGSMSWIERAGLIRFRKGLTNRDYIRAVWRQTPRRDAYTTTALEFERVYFGRRDATQEMFQQCLTSFQEAFREDASTSTAEV